MNNGIRKKWDWPVVGTVLTFILLLCLVLLLLPQQSKTWISTMHEVVTKNFGILFVWIVFLSIGACVTLALSSKGSIVLGESPKEYSEFSWASMLFCASMAAGFIYWGSIQWVFHYAEPPFGMIPFSVQGAELAATLPIFYFGFSAWSVYLIPAVAFAHLHYNLKQEKFDISNACRPVLGSLVDGPIGKIINVFFLFGILGGIGTSLGIGSPLVSASLHRLFGLEDTPVLRFGVMILVTLIFTLSAYHGIKKGIRILSNVNVALMLMLVAVLFVFGNTLFILKMQTTSLGILIQYYIPLSTHLDPVGTGNHTENWTVFYWAWWMSYSLFMGLFIARISKGRTVRQVIFGCLGYGFLGSFTFISIFGNYFMDLELRKLFPVVEQVLNGKGPQTVVEVLGKLPFGNLVLFGLLVTAILSMATSFDSAAFTMALVSSKTLDADSNPDKRLIIFWAVCLAAIPSAIMIFGGSLMELQTLSIVLALPTCLIYTIVVVGCFKMLQKYQNKLHS